MHEQERIPVADELKQFSEVQFLLDADSLYM